MFEMVYEAIIFRIKNIGKLPICNCKKHRAPTLFNITFILCWRCTSIIIPLVILKKFYLDIIPKDISNIYLLLIGFLLVLPTTVDGIRQYFFGVESTNFKRIVTGIPCGVGLFIIIPVLKSIFN